MAPLLDYVQSGLKRFTNLQIKYTTLFALLLIAFTLFSLIGITQIELQSDLSKLDPQDLDFTELNNKINSDFHRYESTVIIVQLNEDLDDPDTIHDIRDPAVMRYIIEVQDKLKEEETIQEVSSIADIFGTKEEVPPTLEEVKDELSKLPPNIKAFDRGYEWTVIFIEADVGGDDKKISQLNDKINEILGATSTPSGVKVITTGDAPLTSTIFRLMISDAFFTLIFATLAIFILVLILERSFKKSLIIILPLLLGLIWTAGTMGWMNIPITIATAAMGAMLLGLGVEYAIFLISRYDEERFNHSLSDALNISVSSVGATLVSSGSTTLIGFLALSLSIFPVLSDLGLTLALGIGFMLMGTIVALPIILLMEERIEIYLKGEKELHHQAVVRHKQEKKLGIQNIYNAYAKFLSHHPYIILILSVLITLAMFYGISTINHQDVDFDTILPGDLDEVKAFIQLNDEFGRTNSIIIYVHLDQTASGSNEPTDIRDPLILDYIDVLSQKAYTLPDVLSVASITETMKMVNGQQLPNSITRMNELYEISQIKERINDDYSATIISITIDEEAEETEIVRQVKEIIEQTDRPAGVVATPSGGIVVQTELEALNGPDSSKTSLIALAGIIIFLYILTRRVKNTILPLFTVVLGIIWTLGLTGFFKVPFNNITTSVITMTIGIGIDFGLQVVNRFNQELETHPKQKAMELTLTSILTPMIITAVAALIGFRAMGLGQLKIMADLGVLMSFGVAGSMLVAITAVAALTLIFQRDKEPSQVNKNLKTDKSNK